MAKKSAKKEYKMIEDKLYEFYHPDGKFEFANCAEWILSLLKKERENNKLK